MPNGYKIEAKEVGTDSDAQSPAFVSAGSSITSYTVSDLAYGKSYKIIVTPTMVDDESDLDKVTEDEEALQRETSQIPCTRRSLTQPNAPTVTPYSTDSLLVSWSPDPRATHYKIIRYNANGVEIIPPLPEQTITALGGASCCSYEDKGLTQDTLYGYAIQSVLEIAGTTIESLRSQQVKVRTRNPINPNEHVDTFIGTGQVSGVFSAQLNQYSRVVPAASSPFGLVRVSTLNTRRPLYFWSTTWGLHDNSNFTYGYYEHTPDNLNTAMLVHGFSMNSLSGPGCPVKFDFPFMMVPGENTSTQFKNRRKRTLSAVATGYGRTLTGYEVAKDNNGNYLRVGKPGYLKYTFKSDSGNPNMDVEFTATRLSGIGKFTFKGSVSKATAVFTSYTSSNRSTSGSSTGYNATKKEVTGIVHGGEFCNPDHNQYKIYMVAKLDQTVTANNSLNSGAERAVVVDVPASKVVHIKFALSYTSLAKARANLAADIPNWDFNAIKTKTQKLWRNILSSIQVNDNARESNKRVFYTALWRAFQHPTAYQDADGTYRGFDNKVHNISEHTTPRPLKNMYTDFSGWDVYRFQTQLLAFLMPEIASDMAQSLTIQARQAQSAHEKPGAAFPRWTVANDDALMMDGDPGQIIVSNIYAFGGRNFDIDDVWEISKSDSTDSCSSNKLSGCRSPLIPYAYFIANGSPDSAQYRKGTSKSNTGQVLASQTLEYVTADFAKAQIAKFMYEKTPTDTPTNVAKRTELETEYNKFIQRAGRWREIIVKNRASSSLSDSGRSFGSQGASFWEGTAAQYRWMIPYDGSPLFERALFSGGDSTLTILEEHVKNFNSATDSTDHMYLGNQVCLATPWLFNYAKKPAKTQKYVRQAMGDLFKDAINKGLPGNDDLGTLSGWYVSAALGLAPTVPGVSIFLINTPYFENMVINIITKNLGDAELYGDRSSQYTSTSDRISIRTSSAGTNSYIKTMTLQKKGESTTSAYDKSYISLKDLIGATLTFTTTDTEDSTSWATSDSSIPPSMSKEVEDESGTAENESEYGMMPDAGGYGAVNHPFYLP